MCTINPKIDIAFKKLFGSEENKHLLLSLINAVIMPEIPIATITVRNPYNISDYLQGKNSILDIKAQDEKSRWFDIEIQTGEQGFYGKRALFYWGKVYTDQLPKGRFYSELNPTIGIHFLDFVYFPDETRYRRCCTIKDKETNEVYDWSGCLELYFVEMVKFRKELEQLGWMLDKWIYFFNRAYEMSKGRIPAAFRQEAVLAEAVEKLDIMYLENDERAVYEGQQKAFRDRQEEIRTALTKGLAEGKAEGLAEGEAKKQREVVKNSILLGLDNQTIHKITGVAVDEIEKIRNGTA